MTDNLTCIDLDQPLLTGFRKFISSWLYQTDRFTILVDPGPLSTIPFLLGELRRLEVKHLDHILLTHIHIDHAGGAGALTKEYPEAAVICHPDGIRHLAAPEKLWQGSRMVLGQLAEVYGEIVPIPAERLRFDDYVGDTGIRAFLTPGHAQHHCSYLAGDLLFAGEVAGVRSDVADGIFMRPATPPRFILDVALASIDRMIAISPRRMVFAHYGLVESAPEHLEIARRQLLLWVKGVAEVSALEESRQEQALVEWLMEHDEHYRNFQQLPDDIKSRERYFFGNTMRGMLEYVAGLTPEQRGELRQSSQL